MVPWNKTPGYVDSGEAQDTTGQKAQVRTDYCQDGVGFLNTWRLCRWLGTAPGSPALNTQPARGWSRGAYAHACMELIRVARVLKMEEPGEVELQDGSLGDKVYAMLQALNYPMGNI